VTEDRPARGEAIAGGRDGSNGPVGDTLPVAATPATMAAWNVR
jgi:hypothetical protein